MTIDIFQNSLQLPKQYGEFLDERVVEYPWLISRIGQGEGKLLDAGSIFNFAYLLENQKLKNKDINISGEEENAQFCMNNLFGNNTNRKYIKESSSNEYNSISSQCHCVNQECPNDHPLTNALREIVRCLGVNISVCNTTIDAGRDFKSQNIDIVQQCGINRKSKPSEAEDAPKPSPQTPTSKSNTMMYITIAIVILLILTGVFFMKR